MDVSGPVDTYLSLSETPGKGSDQSWQPAFQPWAGHGRDAANAQVARCRTVRGQAPCAGLTEQAGQGAPSVAGAGAGLGDAGRGRTVHWVASPSRDHGAIEADSLRSKPHCPPL